MMSTDGSLPERLAREAMNAPILDGTSPAHWAELCERRIAAAIRAALYTRDKEWEAALEGSTGVDPVIVRLTHHAQRQHEGCARASALDEAAKVARTDIDVWVAHEGPFMLEYVAGAGYRIATAIEALKVKEEG